MILIGTGPERRSLPHQFQGNLPQGAQNAIAFTPGCLVIDGNCDPQVLAEHTVFTEWPLVILVDDAKTATSSSLEFLWTVFTRFEPAQDIYFKHKSIVRNGLHFDLPMVIDARMKASYPKEVMPDPETVQLVDKKWNSYFQ